MNITLVRGAFLNPFEMQLYSPLRERHRVTAIGADWQFYPGRFEWPGTLQKPRLWGSALARFHKRAPVLWNRSLSWTMGRSYGLYELAHAIGRPDILHAAESFFTMTYQCLEVKRRLGCPLVVTVSENLPHSGETHPIRRARKRAVLKEADLFLAITETTRQMLLAEGVPAQRIAVIPNSISTEVFAPGPKDPELMSRLQLTSQDLVVLFVGRFVREKGVEEILSAIPGILRRYTSQPIRFCFVGEGPLEGRLRQAAALNPEVIRIHPFVPYGEISRFHRLADIFIMPSKPGPKINEQFGFVLAESMSTAKPVITTRCGSIPDVVGDAAVLIPSGDALALEGALGKLIESAPDRVRLGEKARERVQAHFDAQQNARRVESLYQRLLKPA